MRQVAAFDFDKTLSTRDNVVPFFRLVAGRFGAAASLVLAAPLLLSGRREGAKVLVVRRLFRGRRSEEMREIGQRFADDVVEHHLRPDVLDRVEWHRAQGHEVVLVSASLDVYLEPVGARLGVDAVLCTRLEVGPDGRMTGRLVGHNVRGAEKARRLDAWLDGDTAEIWAYGDSRGDRELLARAEHPVRVGKVALPPLAPV